MSTSARQLTEPLRELSAFALLIANGIFLFLAFSGLFFVAHRWGADFGLRSEAVFPAFVGLVSLGFPLLAMVLATHVAPMVRRSRPILVAVMVELAVSAAFGAITFLGAFAHDLSSARATIEGTLARVVWLALLVLACVIVARVWLGLNPAPRPRPAGYSGHGQPTYGRPYPGQPLYPQSAYPPGTAGSPGSSSGSGTGSVPPVASGALPAGTPTEDPAGALSAESGWPLVPPPPRPAPLVLESAGDQTMRISVPMAGPVPTAGPVPPALSGELTQKIPVQPAVTPAPNHTEPPANPSDTTIPTIAGPADATIPVTALSERTIPTGSARPDATIATPDATMATPEPADNAPAQPADAPAKADHAPAQPDDASAQPADAEVGPAEAAAPSTGAPVDSGTPAPADQSGR